MFCYLRQAFVNGVIFVFLYIRSDFVDFFGMCTLFHEDHKFPVYVSTLIIVRVSQIPKALRNVTDSEELATFWRTYGRETFREMSVVARGVLGAPTTAAILDRDFADAGNLISTGQCESLGAAYVEMTMFLHGAYDFIPTSIPTLSSEDFEGSIPIRLRDPSLRDEVAGLSGEPLEGQSVDTFLPFGDSDGDQGDCESRAEQIPADWRRA